MRTKRAKKMKSQKRKPRQITDKKRPRSSKEVLRSVSHHGPDANPTTVTEPSGAITVVTVISYYKSTTTNSDMWAEPEYVPISLSIQSDTSWTALQFLYRNHPPQHQSPQQQLL